jgi:hypothetical protein
LLVCTANLGNAQPDAESIARLIPPDGHLHEQEGEIDGNPYYQSPYPLQFMNDEDCETPDDACVQAALEQQLDLIVVGLQEATFDPPKEDHSEHSVRIAVPLVQKHFKKLNTLRAKKDHSLPNNLGTNILSVDSVHSTGSAFSFQPDKIVTKFLKVKRDEWEDGTHVLHSLFEGRLPSYQRLVSYQRGQMRLLIFGRQLSADPAFDPVVPIRVLHTAAQNTGRTGLANKGGIASEVLINQTTRLSFVTCHLEAHEGAAKCAVRCSTLADIFNGTAARKQVKGASTLGVTSLDEMGDSAHVVSPSMNANISIPHDVSLTSHYSFVLGDLNFRTDLSMRQPDIDEETQKQAVRNLVKAKDWQGLNDIDELHTALRQKDCLVGYETLFCNFPPTFKLERQAGYEYVDKRRPSYTDRILFKSNHQLENGVRPILHEPVDDFTSSDHKPIRAAFAVDLNPCFRVRPKAIRRGSKVNLGLMLAGRQRGDKPRRQRPRLWPFGRNVDDNASLSSMDGSINSRTGASTPKRSIKGGNHMQLFISNVSCVLHQSLENAIPPNPYMVLVSQPEEAVRLPWTRNRKWKKLLGLQAKMEDTQAERTKAGWPRSSRKFATYTPNWLGEEVDCRVSTHTEQGGSLDLTGAMLLMTVMNYNPATAEDTVMGTFSFNLANLLRISTGMRGQQRGSNGEGNTSSQRCKGRRVRRSSVFNVFAPKSENNLEEEEDPIAAVDISEPLLKNGREVGFLQCTVEAWWMDENTARIVRVPQQDSPNVVGGRFLNKLKFSAHRHQKAEKRSAFREVPT